MQCAGLWCITSQPDDWHVSEAYNAKADLFEFIQKMPVGKWDESRIINSKIGDYITTARRHGEDWFIASVINQQGGVLDIKLDFLEEGQTYEATFYEDTEETNCKTNPEAYRVRKAAVKKDEVIQAKLASGGGHCMWVRPKKLDVTQKISLKPSGNAIILKQRKNLLLLPGYMGKVYNKN